MHDYSTIAMLAPTLMRVRRKGYVAPYRIFRDFRHAQDHAKLSFVNMSTGDDGSFSKLDSR